MGFFVVSDHAPTMVEIAGGKMLILVMGLPETGKSTLARAMAITLGARHFDADNVRRSFNDWDFTVNGRMAQAYRMRGLCDMAAEEGVIAIADFVCPLQAGREVLAPDYLIWMDTAKAGPYEDTNRIFDPPVHYDIRIAVKDVDYWSAYICSIIKSQQPLCLGGGSHGTPGTNDFLRRP